MLKINLQEGDLPSLHPHEVMIYLRGISIGKTLHEGLMRLGENGSPIFAGAESVKMEPNGLRYTFTLRRNFWSDGTPVTAIQYENGWKEALSPQSTCARADLLYIIRGAQEAKKGLITPKEVGVKALDDQTLVVELAYPSPHFLELLAHPICAPLQDVKNKELSSTNGPFMLDKWQRSQKLLLKPNPHFWNKAQVSLKGIEISFVQDPLTAFALYEKKQIDWIGVPLSPLSLEQIELLTKQKAIASHPVDRSFWVFLNTRHPAMASKKIRKALSLSIQREQIAKHILIGSRPLSSNTITEQPAEAKKLFEEGLKESGLTRDKFPPLVVTYSQQAGRKQLAEYLQATWSKVLNIDVQLQMQEWNTLRTNLSNGQFMVSGAFEASYTQDPIELLERFTALSSSNFTQWTDPVYGEKIKLAKNEKDQALRTSLLSEAEQILYENMPFIPICADRFFFSHTPSLKGYVFDSVGSIDFSYSRM